jgi:hypothetical protein
MSGLGLAFDTAQAAYDSMHPEWVDADYQDRYEIHLKGYLAQVEDVLANARDLFQDKACPSCRLAGESNGHCFIYDRLTDASVRVVNVHAGNDVYFAAYGVTCEACGIEFFDTDGEDTVCITCKAKVAA